MTFNISVAYRVLRICINTFLFDLEYTNHTLKLLKACTHNLINDYTTERSPA